MIVLLPLLFLVCAVSCGYVIGWHAGREAERDVMSGDTDAGS